MEDERIVRLVHEYNGKHYRILDEDIDRYYIQWINTYTRNNFPFWIYKKDVWMIKDSKL